VEMLTNKQTLGGFPGQINIFREDPDECKIVSSEEVFEVVIGNTS